MIWIVPEGLPDLTDCGVDAVLGIEKNILAPEALDNLLAADHVAILFRQQDEQLHGNAFKLQGLAIAPEYRANVNTSEAPYDRRQGDVPALSDAEIDDVIAFLRTLSDGYVP